MDTSHLLVTLALIVLSSLLFLFQFIGRGSKKTRKSTRKQNTNNVLLCGPSGTGKTSLILALHAQCNNSSNSTTCNAIKEYQVVSSAACNRLVLDSEHTLIDLPGNAKIQLPHLSKQLALCPRSIVVFFTKSKDMDPFFAASIILHIAQHHTNLLLICDDTCHSTADFLALADRFVHSFNPASSSSSKDNADTAVFENLLKQSQISTDDYETFSATESLQLDHLIDLITISNDHLPVDSIRKWILSH